MVVSTLSDFDDIIPIHEFSHVQKFELMSWRNWSQYPLLPIIELIEFEKKKTNQLIF